MLFFDKRMKKIRDIKYEEQEEEKGKELEKKDVPALLISSFLVLWLPATIILLIICGLAFLLLGIPFAG